MKTLIFIFAVAISILFLMVGLSMMLAAIVGENFQG